MNDKPSTALPPPKRPWKRWQWLLLFTPGLLMVVGAAKGIRPSDGGYGVMTSGLYTGPIVIFICLFLATKLTQQIGKNDFSANLLLWFLCFSGLVAANLAIGLAGCAMVFNLRGTPRAIQPPHFQQSHTSKLKYIASAVMGMNAMAQTSERMP